MYLQVIAQEVYDCCMQDFDSRIRLLLQVVTDLDWLPYFQQLTEKDMASPLVFALSRQSNKVRCLKGIEKDTHTYRRQ